ncbi:MAG TPA: DUF1800 domain-containing protein [Rhodanobacteraceae bacterium]|nr:DUF1800 domain-containing protein [Rhodanobacteraceae bacterium]
MGVSSNIVSAVNRFGLGARPGDLQKVRDARGWLESQIASGADGAQTFAALPGSLDYLKRESQYKLERRNVRQNVDMRADSPGRRALLGGDTAPTSNAPAPAGDAVATADARKDKALPPALREIKRELRDDLFAEASARFRLAASTETPFMERLVRFWSNHFAVSLDKGPARMYAAPMEREAIRPHVRGRFADMLLAVEMHPAMLRYLDNVQSIGPDSRVGVLIAQRLARKGDDDKGKAGGLNENLGREIMELHTLGVNGGYTQADVTELARAITGWSTPLPRDFGMADRGEGMRRGLFGFVHADDHGQPTSAFVFRANAHEPGSRTVMGKRYAEGGVEQGRAILADLARHSATAEHLSLKLARHFVADEPPPALVARMAKTYLDHDTDLAAVYRTLVESPEAWGESARKFKTPQDFVNSSLRAGAIDIGEDPKPLLGLLNTLGEPVFTPRSPAGFPDIAANWMDADALWKRVQAAEALSQRVARTDRQPLQLAQGVLGPLLDSETAMAIRRAESVQQAIATLFACPAFQWRV